LGVGDTRFSGSGARGDHVLFGRYAGQKPLLTGKIALRQREASATGLHFAIQLGGFPAFNNRQHRAALHALAQIARERDHPPADGGGNDLCALRIPLDQSGQIQPPRTAHRRMGYLYACRTDLFVGEETRLESFLVASSLAGSCGLFSPQAASAMARGSAKANLQWSFMGNPYSGAQRSGAQGGRGRVIGGKRVDGGYAGLDEGAFGIEQVELAELASR
jgi:hypothetical protein